MIASLDSQWAPQMSRRTAAALATLLLFALPACSTRMAPVDTVLDPLPRETHPLPTRGDRAAVHLMEAALGNDAGETELAFERVRMIQPGLSALAQDVVNATLDDPLAYRAASKELLDQGGLHPLLKGRLKEAVSDDPVRLANKRIFDHRHTIFARTFNAVVEPIGTSLITGATLVPYKLALSAGAWAMAMWEEDPLTLPERQALVHRRRFLKRHPDAPEAERVREQIADAEVDLKRTRERHFMYSARLAMDSHQPRLAEYYVARAQEQRPEKELGSALRENAHLQIALHRERRHRSVGWDGSTPPDDLAIEPELLASHVLDPSLEARLSILALFSPTAVRGAAEALLLPGSDLLKAAESLRAADPEGELEDEAAFIQAIGEYESGLEKRSWRSFDRLARRSPEQSNMARHAAAIVNNPRQNPYGSFLHEKKRSRVRLATFHLFGSSTQVRRFKALPMVAGYVLAAPRVAQAALTSPFRLIAGNGKGPDFKKGMSIAGYRYLERYPDGAHKDEVVSWLYGYEEKKENWRAALRLADSQPDFDRDKRQELVEKTAGQLVARAGKIQRRDQRGMLLRSAARDYPDSEAGHTAGETARLDAEFGSGQRIRMTRGFLRENPAVAGRGGLGVRAALLDGELENGELHPHGVTFLGGRLIEVALLDKNGDEDADPVLVNRPISEERLARAVAMLDEMSIHNARIDRDYTTDPDAQRDLFFERARLGLTGVADRRALAQSTFVYKSVRERYGMVRSRESILPFDLVFRGSVGDLGLGAFPRWREPKSTPDAFLYR